MKRLFTFGLALGFAACSQKTVPASGRISLMHAQELAQRFVITDGHIDVPYRLNAQAQKKLPVDDVSQATEGGDFDYVRAKAGGLNLPFMSIYIPAFYQRTGGAKKFGDKMIDIVEKIASDNPDKFSVAASLTDALEGVESGHIVFSMGMENGAGLEDDLDNIAYFHKRGIRYITLTHSEDNKICDSSYDTTHTWNGLSPFGQKVIPEMNKVGIMVDVSHISDSAFYQVMALAKAPVIASHSSCRHFIPDFERNMSDDMIRVLAQHKGVIQINFGSTFIDSTSVRKSKAWRKASKDFFLDNEVEGMEDPRYLKFKNRYMKKHGTYFSTVQVAADHIEHVVKLVGVDYVGFGSDFDGVGDSLPVGLKDVSMYPNLIYELLKRGFSDEDIEKVCSKNALRVWAEVEKIAGK